MYDLVGYYITTIPLENACMCKVTNQKTICPNILGQLDREKKKETKDRQELSANVKQFYLTNMH